MNEDSRASNHEEADQSLISSLLQSAYEDESAETARRVSRLMTVLNDKSSGSPLTSENDSIAVGRRHSWAWVSLSATAAALLIMMLFFPQSASSHEAALRTVQKTIAAENRDLVREYQVHIDHRSNSERQRVTDHRLFVRKRQFVIRTAAFPGYGDKWIGGDSESRWLVPAHGPVFIGSAEKFRNSRFRQDLVETPFLSLSAILQRIRRHYDLRLSEDVELQATTGTQTLDYVVGARRKHRGSIPETVKLWVDRNTGFAVRIELEWGSDDAEARWNSATAELIDTHSYGNEFFRHQAHHDQDRRVVEVL